MIQGMLFFSGLRYLPYPQVHESLVPDKTTWWKPGLPKTRLPDIRNSGTQNLKLKNSKPENREPTPIDTRAPKLYETRISLCPKLETLVPENRCSVPVKRNSGTRNPKLEVPETWNSYTQNPIYWIETRVHETRDSKTDKPISENWNSSTRN